MEQINIRDLTFFYPEQKQAALSNVDLTVRQGEFIVMAGLSGSGKTTLLRQMKPELRPHGTRRGQIIFNGVSLDKLDRRGSASQIGFIMQDPDNQIATDKVWHEMAFGLESLGADNAFIRRRVAETASFFGIENWFDKNVNELSGGQKQLLNLASVLVMDPQVLILDEPSSKLDPLAAGKFLSDLGRINRELGKTVILSEHRLEEVLHLCDRLIIMDQGRICYQGSPEAVIEEINRDRHSMIMAMPTPVKIWNFSKAEGAMPMNIAQGRRWLAETVKNRPLKSLAERPVKTFEESAIEMKEVHFRYAKNDPEILRGLDLQVGKGELLCLLGGNGSGKSTIMQILSGNVNVQAGSVRVSGRAALIPQDPKLLFVKKTLREDLLLDLKKKEAEKIDSIINICRIDHLLDRHPYDLSGGEQQRAALAKVLLRDPEILLLDEPTKGIDASYKSIFADILHTLLEEGTTILMVSHDIEFCSEHADRCAMLFHGEITAQGVPTEFFSGGSYYSPAAERMARGLVPGAITWTEVVETLDGRIEEFDGNNINIDNRNNIENEEQYRGEAPVDGRLPRRRRTRIAGLMILLVVPLTIFAGTHFFNDRKYYFISLLILMEVMLPFAVMFEKRRPQARELVVTAVLCAIAVAGRTAFMAVPGFKPVMALVIISGVAFGGETGFLVGAVSMFLSNILFGQGPWTPWQMFAMGIVGFLAGTLFQKGLLSRSRLSLGSFGLLSAVLIYGGLMNPASVIMFQEQITPGMLLTAYITGFPVDLVHGAATFIFLWFLSGPMLEKLDRIKVKYGLLEP